MNNLSAHLAHFPEESRDLVLDISASYAFDLKMKNERKSKLGDFRYPMNGEVPVITLNRDPNPYRLLITYLHELAHLIVYLEVGRKKNPHGPRWKKRYGMLIDIFLNVGVFPVEMTDVLRKHSISPKASSHADISLMEVLRAFDPGGEKLLLNDLEENEAFSLGTERVFRKGKLRRTRVLCEEVGSRRRYLIHKHAQVFRVE